jgi:ADP-ribose pyrophosphatase YjhB (NUDIX family)
MSQYLSHYPTNIEFKGKLFTMRTHKINENTTFESIVGRDGVMIITVNEAKQFGVSIQSQLGRPNYHSLAGGYIEDNQTVQQALEAELSQEFGCTAKRYSLVETFAQESKIQQKTYLYLATGVNITCEQCFDEHEQIHSIDWICFGSFVNWCMLQGKQTPSHIFMQGLLFEYLITNNFRKTQLHNFLSRAVGKTHINEAMESIRILNFKVYIPI